MSDEVAKRRGRPPNPKRKQGNLTFRTPGGLRDRLAKAAEVSGRSISEEITFRLELQFEDERRKLEDKRRSQLEEEITGNSAEAKLLIRREAGAISFMENLHGRELIKSEDGRLVLYELVTKVARYYLQPRAEADLLEETPMRLYALRRSAEVAFEMATIVPEDLPTDPDAGREPVS